jgi:hypothetical protein
MMVALIEFENRLVAFEVVSHQQSGLLELRQHAVDGSQPNVFSAGKQYAVNVFSGKMALLAALEQRQDFKPRQSSLETNVFEFL